MSYSMALLSRQSPMKLRHADCRCCARLGVRRSLFDFKSNLAVVPRGDRVEDCANRLRSTALLAYYSAQVFLRHAQFKQRRSGTPSLRDLDSVRVVNQLLRP